MSIPEKYSIKEVEALTGISAYNLRAWEKRYASLLPHRTESNIRYYDALQVRRLLNISGLMPLGYKASQLLALTDRDLHSLVTETAEDTAEEALLPQVNSLVTAMLDFDEPAFGKTLAAAISRLGMYNAMLQVIYPFLYKTGVLWSTSNTSPAQEHFASSLLQRKIQSALEALPGAEHTDKRFLLFLPPGERHEMGLLFADYVIRGKGYVTIYLGGDLPYESLHFALEKTKPTHLLTFFTVTADADAAIAQLLKMIKGKPVKLLVCTHREKSIHKTGSKLHLLEQPAHLLNYL